MFGGEDIDKKVKVLSGGEKTRLAMIKLLLEPVNFLILDEPTNHLDLRTKDILKEAIKAFDGTVIVVSHDRDFLDGLVSKVYEFGGGKVRENLGGIYDFLRSRNLNALDELQLSRRADQTSSSPRQTPQSEPDPEPAPSNGKLSYEEMKARERALRKAEKCVKEAEERIAQLEEEQSALEEKLAQGESSPDILES